METDHQEEVKLPDDDTTDNTNQNEVSIENGIETKLDDDNVNSETIAIETLAAVESIEETQIDSKPEKDNEIIETETVEELNKEIVEEMNKEVVEDVVVPESIVCESELSVNSVVIEDVTNVDGVITETTDTEPVIEEVENNLETVTKENEESIDDVENKLEATETEVYIEQVPDVINTEEVNVTIQSTENEYVETEVPVEEVSVPILEEQVILEEATDLPVINETVVNDTIEENITVNGMPVLSKEVEEKIDENLKLPDEGDSLASIEQAVTAPEETLPIPAREESEQATIIPLHILGHNVDPVPDDLVRNGKVRKPRLGVKIPYRNLTSQIVSKQEIAEEIMERSRLRNASAEIPAGGDIFFTKKLTKRLANKLIKPTKPSEFIKKEPSSSSTSSLIKKVSDSNRKDTPSASTTVTVANIKTDIISIPTKKIIDTSSKITDNSDLIAILEGNDDTDWTLERPSKSKNLEKRTPEWERETALKQLRELPKTTGRSSKSLKSSPERPKPTLKEEDDPLYMLDDSSEPRFSMGLVTKTYTRKRKSSGDIKILTTAILQQPPPKKMANEKDKQLSITSSSKSSKSYTPKPSVNKQSEKQHEMPSLKKETPVVKILKHSFISTPNKESTTHKVSENVQPNITKTNLESKPDIIKTPLSPNTYISKSSRIVKKKKIWDPDEDNTPKYFKSPPVKPIKVIETSESHPEKKTNSDTPSKPAVLKPSNEKTPSVKKHTVKKVIMKKKKPKRLTEVDRLLMDEGAVNLLYSVKNTDEIQTVKKKKSVISIDRAQRELLDKTNEIKNDLQINSTKDSPITLRKKEGPPKISPAKEVAAAILQRKKSTGSAHSPPASPAFYNQHAEASRIIRRHSSSSFSSENPEGDESGYSERSSKSKGDIQRKKVRAHSERNSSALVIDKQHLSEEMAKNFNKSLPHDAKYSKFSTFSVRTFKNFVQIILAPSALSGGMTLSIDALAELRAVLHLLKNDNDCSVVLFSSSGNSFCEGLNYKQLVCSNKTECINVAENYATSVTDFLISLAEFPKILVAGVHGNTIGLGVTMLPLFDMILASDSATFSTPYTKLGCVAEGGVLLTLPHVMHSALASELFYASRKLTAGEGLRLGLVTRTLWPDKFQDELIAIVKSVAKQSLQSMQAIKKQLRGRTLADVESSLKSEASLLVQHWTSKECQNNFVNYSVESK